MNRDFELHIFDLDHTLINADSDYEWKVFAVEKKLIAPDALQKAADYYDDYRNGVLDVDAFIRFQFAEFAGKSIGEIRSLTGEFFEKNIRPHVRTDGRTLICKLHESGKRTAILSSTCEPLVRPAAEYFGIDDVIGTQLETSDGVYTGNISGIYSLGKGKIAAAEKFCSEHGFDLKNSVYYGDSINDRFIMAEAGKAAAVNPDAELTLLAAENNWQILNWR